MSTTVTFTCPDCRALAEVDIATIRIKNDPAAVVLVTTCTKGHVTERRLHLTDDARFIETFVSAWIDSPAFDVERADLRLTGGAA